ncbi:hypothetical protein [Nocardia sp. NPDC056100]|uniref:hypothetical protein n=1 Tax=Nocardia sp. NPDC056100 TaxID=3345712 RepID=UPI0035DCB77C
MVDFVMWRKRFGTPSATDSLEGSEPVIRQNGCTTDRFASTHTPIVREIASHSGQRWTFGTGENRNGIKPVELGRDPEQRWTFGTSENCNYDQSEGSMTELLKTLYVTTPGTSLHLDGDALRVFHPDRPGRHLLPLIRLEHLVVFNGVTVTDGPAASVRS